MQNTEWLIWLPLSVRNFRFGWISVITEMFIWLQIAKADYKALRRDLYGTCNLSEEIFYDENYIYIEYGQLCLVFV